MDGSMRTRCLVILLGILVSVLLFGFKSANEDTSKLGIASGIDFGITCSWVGDYKDGQMPEENFDLTGIPPAPRRTPQIEVTSELDANGILNVKAGDKVAGKLEKITIINENGQLTQDEIDRMVQEAEQFAEEDKKVEEKIDACNRLETYIQKMKETIYHKDKLAEKLESDEQVKVEDAILGTTEWLVDNESARKEDYDEMLKELEAICNPIISAVYQRYGATPGGSDSSDDDDVNDEQYTLCSWLRI